MNQSKNLNSWIKLILNGQIIISVYSRSNDYHYLVAV